MGVVMVKVNFAELSEPVCECRFNGGTDGLTFTDAGVGVVLGDLFGLGVGVDQFYLSWSKLLNVFGVELMDLMDGPFVHFEVLAAVGVHVAEEKRHSSDGEMDHVGALVVVHPVGKNGSVDRELIWREAFGAHTDLLWRLLGKEPMTGGKTCEEGDSEGRFEQEQGSLA
jgi:hypothetical protein